ncbi:MAG: hypothetical protein EZS28_056212, partial [Streblomastix strix]
MDNQ